MEENIQEQTIEVIRVEPRLVTIKDGNENTHYINARSFKGVFPIVGSVYTGRLVKEKDIDTQEEKWRVKLKKAVPLKPFSQINSRDEEIKLKLNILYYRISDCINTETYNNLLATLSKRGYYVENLRLLPCYNLEKKGLSNLFKIFASNPNQSNEQLRINLKSFIKKKSGRGWSIVMKEINRIYKFDEEKTIKEHCFQENIINLTNFSVNSSKIKIYIDEAWISNTNRGFIAGLIWDGNSINKKLLPTRQTHTTEQSYLEKDPELLLNCNKALPFIISFNENNYSEVFTKAIKFILGWLLPQTGNACEVTINAEYYSDINGEYPINTDKTKEFQKLFKELQTKSKFRYQRWIIKEVKWVDKNYEYVPWGDLLGYLASQRNDLSKQYYKHHNIDKLYGTVELTEDFINVLNKLEQDDFNANSYIDLIKLKIKNTFTSELEKHIDRYISKNDKAIQQIIEETDRYFSNKSISVNEQEQIVTLINKHIDIPNIVKTSNSRSRLTWYTQLIKNANNHGEPLKANNYFGYYIELRKKVIENDRELVAKSDLNITVSLNDNFEFQTSYEFAKKNIEDQSFRYLSLFNRAKISSSFAQTLSILQNYEKADEYYSKALSFMQESDTDDSLKTENLDKILTYKIINAFDGNLRNKNKIFSELFKNPQEVYSNLKSNKIRDPYLVYTLLRTAYFHSEFRTYYIGLPKEEDINSALYHPWELIYLYDALLSNDKSRTHKLNKSISICNQDNQGSTMKLIGYTINMISELLGVKLININSDNIKEYLNENLTPALEYYNKMLEIKGSNKPKDKKIQMILECLPFYYH